MQSKAQTLTHEPTAPHKQIQIKSVLTGNRRVPSPQRQHRVRLQIHLNIQHRQMVDKSKTSYTKTWYRPHLSYYLLL